MYSIHHDAEFVPSAEQQSDDWRMAALMIDHTIIPFDGGQFDAIDNEEDGTIEVTVTWTTAGITEEVLGGDGFEGCTAEEVTEVLVQQRLDGLTTESYTDASDGEDKVEALVAGRLGDDVEVTFHYPDPNPAEVLDTVRRILAENAATQI